MGIVRCRWKWVRGWVSFTALTGGYLLFNIGVGNNQRSALQGYKSLGTRVSYNIMGSSSVTIYVYFRIILHNIISLVSLVNIFSFCTTSKMIPNYTVWNSFPLLFITPLFYFPVNVSFMFQSCIYLSTITNDI